MLETITPGDCPLENLYPGVALRTFVSRACGSSQISTGLVRIEPGCRMPLHVQGCSAAMTVLEGCGVFEVQDRRRRLEALDSLHVPAGLSRLIRNEDDQPLVLHWALATADPGWRQVAPASPGERCEHVIRRSAAEVYELAPGAHFQDLFAARFGASGICGGYGRFEPGASLPCHLHHYDESITIVEGRARCLVQGSGYQLSGYDTAFVPRGRPHRFLNKSDRPMAMVWVYAGDEPERTVLEAGYCSGELAWPPGAR
jgi:quercetin dioxygenase-like cupin family protein